MSRKLLVGGSIALLAAAAFGGGLTYVSLKAKIQLEDDGVIVRKVGLRVKWKVKTADGVKAFATFQNGSEGRLKCGFDDKRKELTCATSLLKVQSYPFPITYVIDTDDHKPVRVTTDAGWWALIGFKSGPGNCKACTIILTQ